MPIALQLQEVTAAFRYGARVLEPWNRLVWVEELLINRARSAFLFKWFGYGLPLHGFEVRVAISNLDALRERYEKVKAETQKAAEGPNLTEPLLGMAGTAVGMMLTPGVAMGTAIAIVRSLDWTAVTFLDALKEIGKRIAIIGGALLAPAVAVLSPALAAASFLGYLAMGVEGAPQLRAVFDLLGWLAKVLNGATAFIKLLLGPRSAIKNPMLLGLLHLLDQVAKVFPYILAFIAVVVTRFGPMLLPLAAIIGAFRDLATALFDTIVFILSDFAAQFVAVFVGPTNIVSPLKSLLARLTKTFTKVVKTFRDTFKDAKDVLDAWYTDVKKQVKDWGLSLKANLKALIKTHPISINIDQIIEAFKLAGTMLSRPSTTTAPSKPGPFDPWIARAKQWADDAQKAATKAPDLPTIETPGEMMDRLGLEKKYGIPKDTEAYAKEVGSGLPPASEAVEKYVERARHPASAFAYEKRALAKEFGAKSAREALEAAHAKELDLRNALEAIVGRILPPAMRHYMGAVVDTFEMFDETVTLDPKKATAKPKEKKKEKKKEATSPELKFPVKDLPGDNGRLRPLVQRLVLHSKSGRRDDLREFLESLTKKLDRPYPAPA